MVEITASKEHINNESVSPLGRSPSNQELPHFETISTVICELHDLLLVFHKIPEGLLHLPLSFKVL